MNRNIAALNGTIPVSYRGTSYNIPVSLKLPQEYPLRGPDVFVVPTANMVIKPSPHVDAQGRVYHPVLAYWGQSGRDSNLSMLIEVMREIFGLQSPLYSKPNPAGSPASATAANPPYYSPSITSSHSAQSNNQQQQQQQHPFSEQDEERIRMESLRSAVQEKMTPQLIALHEIMSKDVEKLLDDNKALSDGGSKVKNGISALKQEIASFDDKFIFPLLYPINI